MAQYQLTTMQIHEIGGGSEVSIIDFSPSPRRTVNVENMRELESAFDAFVAEMQAAAACYRVMVFKIRACRARKFNGFEKATNRGGRLCQIVNRHIAEAAYVANNRRAA